MVSARRLGSEQSATRDKIIKAAVEVLQGDGATKLTAARIAEQAGVKPHLVHYYFRTMDDLVTAVVRMHGQMGLKGSARVMMSDDPLRVLWDGEMAYGESAAAIDFGVLASDRPVVQEELKRNIEDIRTVQAEALARHFEMRDRECPYSPLAITLMIAAIARQISRERGLGVTLGHRETIDVVDAFLTSISTARPAS